MKERILEILKNHSVKAAPGGYVLFNSEFEDAAAEIQGLMISKDRVIRVLNSIIPMAEDALKQYQNNASVHQEFIKDDKDDINEAKQLVIDLMKSELTAESEEKSCESCGNPVNDCICELESQPKPALEQGGQETKEEQTAEITEIEVKEEFEKLKQVVKDKYKKPMSAKKWLQNKYPSMRGYRWNITDIDDDWVARQMEEYAAIVEERSCKNCAMANWPTKPKEATDEMIEKWANEKLPYVAGKWDNRISERLGLIAGAKAMRDGKIK